MVLVALEDAALGRRLDRALVDALVQAGYAVTRSQLARSFRRGQVRHGGRDLAPSHVVERPMTVAVELPAPEPLHAFAEAIPLVIVHEDADLIVVDKPPGMPVHAGPGHATGTLVNAVLHHVGAQAAELPVLPGNEPWRPGLVHRLDRGTSGLIVLAKHARALEVLAAQFRAHAIERGYLGLVRGEPGFLERRVETTHARDPSDRRRFAPEVPGATRRAITSVRVLERAAGAARVVFSLETGRTHQVRMHARFLGHPLVGDPLYGGPPSDRRVREVGAALGRQALHAAQLGFAHPAGGHVRFESPEPADLIAAWASLRPGG